MTFVLHLDNLDYRCTTNDIIKFLGTDPKKISEIKLVKNDKGQANGDAFVEIFQDSDIPENNQIEKFLKLSGNYMATLEFFDDDCNRSNNLAFLSSEESNSSVGAGNSKPAFLARKCRVSQSTTEVMYSNRIPLKVKGRLV